MAQTQVGRKAILIKNVVIEPQLLHQGCGNHVGKKPKKLNSEFPSFCEYGRNFCGAQLFLSNQLASVELLLTQETPADAFCAKPMGIEGFRLI
jgi:hypothetical protein